jgi:hypothetical protein
MTISPLSSARWKHCHDRGATLMVFGGYQTIGEAVRLDLRLVEVESVRTIRAVFRTAPAANVPELLRATRAASADLM